MLLGSNEFALAEKKLSALADLQIVHYLMIPCAIINSVMQQNWPCLVIMDHTLFQSYHNPINKPIKNNDKTKGIYSSNFYSAHIRQSCFVYG